MKDRYKLNLKLKCSYFYKVYLTFVCHSVCLEVLKNALIIEFEIENMNKTE